MKIKRGVAFGTAGAGRAGLMKADRQDHKNRSERKQVKIKLRKNPIDTEE